MSRISSSDKCCISRLVIVRYKANHLFDNIASFSALRIAARKAIKGKRKKPGAAAFMANFECELLRLERELQNVSYRPGNYVEILVQDPKKRLVSAAPFRDRVVHHALCAVIQPILERSFIANSFANRTGKGTHKAIITYERYRNRHTYVLRADIYRYFPSIDHEILKTLFRRHISCEHTLWLMDTIVDGSNKQEPVELYFPGDDLFSPFEHRRGLPIGNLTSQFFANLYLDRLDHFVTERLGAPYVRYVDDFALFANDPAELANWRFQIEHHLEGRRLKLHPRKTHILSTSESTTFLGFTLQTGIPNGKARCVSHGRRRLPDGNVARFRNRLRGLRDQWRAGTITSDDIKAKVNAWIAHAEHADTWRLRKAIFKGGWFDDNMI